jgi:hypothetical protein
LSAWTGAASSPLDERVRLAHLLGRRVVGPDRRDELEHARPVAPRERALRQLQVRQVGRLEHDRSVRRSRRRQREAVEPGGDALGDVGRVDEGGAGAAPVSLEARCVAGGGRHDGQHEVPVCVHRRERVGVRGGPQDIDRLGGRAAGGVDQGQAERGGDGVPVARPGVPDRREPLARAVELPEQSALFTRMQQDRREVAGRGVLGGRLEQGGRPRAVALDERERVLDGRGHRHGGRGEAR